MPRKGWNNSWRNQWIFAVEGKGVRADVDGKKILIGNRLFLSESGIDYSFVDNKITEMEQQGKTVILVADFEKLLGTIAIADPLKKTSQRAVTELKKWVVMWS